MKKNKTIFIIAGESSGDLHGAGVKANDTLAFYWFKTIVS